MQQNRDDDKYEGSDDSEYHFSDDEVSYEADSEVSKATAASNSPKAGQGSALQPSKRMLISLVVFVGLVYVVYKMVSPATTTPPTDITTPAVIAQKKPAAMTATAPATAQQPVAAVPAEAVPATPVAAPNSTNSMQMAVQQAPTVVVEQPEPTTPSAISANNTTNMAPLSAMPAPAAPTGTMNTSAQPTVAAPATGMPAMIPVQSTATMAYPANNAASYPQGQSQNPVDLKIAALQAENTRLMSQLEMQYTQKINEFTSQNKALQDQVQSLSSRMVTMESQLSQLVQTLTTKQNPSPASSMPILNVAPEQPGAAATEPKVSFNVQAVIPGRAWLRSDSGETITVAEGDVIKDLGRVSKIDPYDGVVEVNTGSKVVSLSYGTGA